MSTPESDQTSVASSLPTNIDGIWAGTIAAYQMTGSVVVTITAAAASVAALIVARARA